MIFKSIRRVLFAIFSVVSLLATNIAAHAADDTCKEDGGTAYCFGPQVEPWVYQVADGSIAAQGLEEASTIAAYKAAYEAALNPFGVCSITLTDNRPPIPPSSYGTGVVTSGNYSQALFMGIGQYITASWRLSTDQQSEQIPLIMHAVYGNNCQNTNHHGVYVYRYREVTCPGWPRYSVENHTGIPGAYCYRTPPARDPDKDFCDECLKAGNPINIGNGNKHQTEEDYVGKGSSPLRFVRYYNNRLWTSTSPSAPAWRRSHLGINWQGSYDRHIRFPNSVAFPTAYAYRHDGRTLHFRRFGGVFKADDDIADRLEAVTDGSGAITGWRYTIASTDEVETYDSAGELLSIRSRDGVTQTMAYAGGRLTSVEDSFGATISFTYNVDNSLQSFTDPAGQVYSYTYNTTGNVASVTYPDGTSRTYIYGENVNTDNAPRPYAMTGIVDESANRFATFKYDNSEYGISTEHAGGVEKYSLSYSGTTGSTTTNVVDPLGQQRVYQLVTLNAVPKAVSVTQTCTPGCVSPMSSTSYDVNGNVSTRSDFKGNVTTYGYDLARNLETSRTEAYGTPRARSITTQWHPTYRLPIQIDEPGKRTTFTHDASGNVLTRTLLDTSTNESRTWTYTYNSFGQVLTADGPRADVPDVTTYTYYSCTTGYQCGQVHTITNAAGHITTYNTYNAHGQPLTITDPNGVTTTLTYDLRQRLKSRTIGTEATTFDYWPTGLLKKVTLPDSSYLEYTYDAAHRLTDINDADGNHIHYALDNMGNRTGEQAYDPSNALVRTRTRVFDTLNRLQKEIGAAGTANVTTTYGYDNNDNQTSVAAPLGRDATQGYDELNRLSQVTDPLNGVTHYGYDALDQLISVTDPKGLATTYTYNALGDLEELHSPDTGVTTSTYDSGGNLATSTDARNAVATYGYDALNRVSTASFAIGSTADQTLTYTYDTGTYGKGRLTGVSDSNHSLSWAYDDQGRVLTAGQTVGSVSKTISYTYANGLRQSMTTPSGQVITYSYTNGKVTSISVNGTVLVSNILYDPFGPVRQWTWGNGSLSVRTFDQDGKISQIDSAGLKTYSYDDAFRITGITDTTNSALSWTYGYDDLDRLTSASKAGTTLGYTYDANGNRLTQTGANASTFTVAANSNRLTSTSGALARTYGYDNAGNTTSYTGVSFTYNDRGRMSSSTKNAATTNYTYNALGQLVKKGTNTLYYYDDAGHILGFYNGSGALTEEIVWLGDIPIVSLRPKAGGGINIYNIHTDHLNTPRLITGSVNTAVRWQWDAEPFGGGTVNNNPSGAGLFDFNLRFPGQIVIPETGLYYNNYRDYDASTGRYVKSDPIGLDGGINTYLYASANPVANGDPLGLFNVRAYETFDPANNSYNWRYEFSFGSCAQGLADIFGPRLLPPAVRRIIGGLGKLRPDPAGDADISDFLLRCHCQQYDPELKKAFDAQFGDSLTYSQSQAQQAVEGLKRKLKELEGDCPKCVAAYNWNSILPAAVERGRGSVRRLRPGG